MAEVLKVPLVLTAQPEGGYRVTSPLLPELATGGATPAEAVANVRSALQAVIQSYEEQGRPLPRDLRGDPDSAPIRFEGLVALP